MTPDFSAFREQFYALVEGAQHIVITSHFSPDDDSIGSVLSVYTILTTKYPEKDIRIMYTGEKVDRYKTFKYFDKIEFVPDIATALTDVELLIMLDGSSYSRFSKTPELLQQNAPKTVAIDHHGGQPDPFTLSLVLPNFSSNCEIIFRALDVEPLLTKELAEVLLAGIVSDTGSFNHINPAQADVFSVAKILLQHVGTSIDALRSRYNTIPQRVIPLLKELMKNTTYQSVPGWPDVQYTYIDRAVITEGGYTDEDMSSASHIYIGQYLPRVEGYTWGFVATPRSDGGVRMSSRSLPGGVNVRDLHERMGIGGGHDRASGADFKKETVDREPKQCIVEVLEWMGHNVPLIG
ncbi:MAG TPA: DHH family phosphoesterase [Candidatus Paceibacterota bacterium]|jgi:phosphoesterase RecJ-like protein|nr:DHH family phosphoesterase [Candidatus Paceibacterota bacterium]